MTTSDGEKGKKLCRYIIHTVGSKYDGSGEICSSSRIQTLENCYHSVIDEVKKHPDIRNVAVPVIGAGDYGFPFKLAMEIAVCSINNALLEWRQKDPELFEKAKLERVYIFIFHPSKAKTDEKFQTANWVMQKYHQLLMSNRKITYLTSRQAHLSYWKEIRMYDRERGYFSIARSAGNLNVHSDAVSSGNVSERFIWRKGLGKTPEFCGMAGCVQDSAAICESDVSELDNGKMAIGRIVGIDCV